MFAPDELLLALTRADVRFVVIRGVAVGVHGYVRATKDLDIVPDPDPGSLGRLAGLLRELGAEHTGADYFSSEELPHDPTDPVQLAEGGNFRLETRLGPLDVMQWVSGIEDESAYRALAAQAIGVAFRGTEIRVCGLEHLRAMKRAAGREDDLRDLRELEG